MSLAEQMASSAAMQAVFTARASVQAMLDVEAGLAKAGAKRGLLPAPAAAMIAASCRAETIDLDRLAQDGALAGTVVIPLVKWLKTAVPEAASYVHIGGTSQDIIDTGLVLQLRAGIALLQADLAAMAEAAAALAQDHARTPMLGRTLMQAAMPISFGLKAANWLVAINDSHRAIIHAATEALVLQCGGAAGTLDVLQAEPVAFIEAFGAALNLRIALTPWHTSRAALARLAAAIAGAVAVAGKIGTDIMLMMQSEIGELAEPAAPGRGGSSAMAHKRNPTLGIAARAAATRAPGYVATLLSAAMQEYERAAGAWQAEAAIWPGLMLCASGGMSAMAQALAGLEVFPAAMARNLSLLAVQTLPPAIDAFIDRALKDHQQFREKQTSILEMSR
jgi:3-carboxy-cis,cis-muconate cycloisomerase